MSLYRKQKEGMNEVMRCALSQVCSEQSKRPESTDGRKVTAKSANHMEEGLLPENAVPAVDYMEEDRDSAGNSGNKPGDEARQVDNSSINAEEKRGDMISDAVISVEGSGESEAIVPECRVNLSRIHLSSESTH